MDRIRLNASEWMDFRSGEKKCFLLTNGLGGYCSLTVMGNAARNDQALLMGALKAPTVREHLISNVWETLEVDGEETELFSQEFVNRTQNVEGFRFLEGFEMGSLPVWFYRVKGVEIEKTIGMVQGENTVLCPVSGEKWEEGEFFGSAGDAVCGEGGAAAGGAGFCGGPEVYCEQWCDSFLWDKWGASDGEGEDLEGFVF